MNETLPTPILPPTIPPTPTPFDEALSNLRQELTVTPLDAELRDMFELKEAERKAYLVGRGTGLYEAGHRVVTQLNEAERKAWDSLSRYKFVMFGYWAGVWVHLNRLTPIPRPNPFKCLVDHGKEVMVRDSRFNIKREEK